MDSEVLCRFNRELQADDWLLARLHQYALVAFQVDPLRSLARAAAQTPEQSGVYVDPAQGTRANQY